MDYDLALQARREAKSVGSGVDFWRGLREHEARLRAQRQQHDETRRCSESVLAKGGPKPWELPATSARSRIVELDRALREAGGPRGRERSEAAERRRLANAFADRATGRATE